LISGFRHTGITVKDMDRALAFYCGVLGLVLGSDRLSPDGGQFVGAPGASIRICVLDAPGTSAVIELLEYRNADGTTITGRPVDHGIGHASFWVGDLDGLYTSLVEHGATVVSRPVAHASGRKKFYAQDPDGFWLELTEGPPAS
jgi:catechol 2,3-dioxygenase-like lactoylglutathione lyase family enzyme